MSTVFLTVALTESTQVSREVMPQDKAAGWFMQQSSGAPGQSPPNAMNLVSPPALPCRGYVLRAAT